MIDSEVTSSSWIGAGGVNIVGKELPNNPEYTVNIGVTLDTYLTDTIDGYLRIDFSRMG